MFSKELSCLKATSTCREQRGNLKNNGVFLIAAFSAFHLRFNLTSHLKSTTWRKEGKSRRGGKSLKPNYLMILLLWYSPLLVAATPTCNGVYHIWYGFVVISIIKRGGMDDES